MGLADIHQYAPSKTALADADLTLVIGGRLDNQMNFGNPPFFPETTELVCINGSPEELELNRAADHTLLCDPGAFLDAISALAEDPTWNSSGSWLEKNRALRGEWVDQMTTELTQSEEDDARIHPLQLALDVQQPLGARSEEHTLNSSHALISYAVFCLKKKNNNKQQQQ